MDASISMDFLIQFLKKETDAMVLAQPQINVADNELGKLFVGSQVPFIANSLNTSEGGRNDSFQYKDVGIILEVTPRINSSNEVAMKIHAEASNIRAGETLLGGAIIVETIFQWPGMGMLGWRATTTRDYPVLMGITLLSATMILISNLITDLGYAVADPRIRYD